MKSSAPPPRVIHEAAFYFHAGPEIPQFTTIPAREERIELVIGGRGWVCDEGAMVEVGPGRLLWHIPGDETICRSDPEDPYFCLNVRFGIEEDRPLRTNAHLSHWESVESARQFAEQVVRWYVDESIDREGLIQWIHGTLLIQSRQRVGRAEREKLSGKTRRVLSRLEEEYARRRTLESLAGEVGWSVSHLHAVFKKEIGTTPHEIVQIHRLRRAKELLASTELSVKEIAASCGYSNSAALCHTFRQRTGETPKAWRLRHRGLVSNR